MVVESQTNHVLDAALDYATRGWLVVPVIGKKPWIKAWQQDASTDPITIAGWWAQRPESGVGIQLGPRSGIIDIECDTPEAEAELSKLIGHRSLVMPTYAGRRGKHRLFKWSDKLPSDKAVEKPLGIEFRLGNGDKGAQSVFPPSIQIERHTPGLFILTRPIPPSCRGNCSICSPGTRPKTQTAGRREPHKRTTRTSPMASATAR